ncbi:MAG: SxtJ family membrane protein [Polyangiaceae bacterium]
MDTHGKKPSASGGTEPVEIGVVVFLLGAIAALVVWQALHMPQIAKYVILGAAGVHALLALTALGEVLKELNTKPSASDLRQFGLIFLGGTAALGVVFWQVFDHNLDRAKFFFIAGAAVMVLSLIPPIGRYLYIVWMFFGLTMGLVTSPVIMFLLFLLLIVPVGIIFKLTGRDLMRRKLDDKADSYWEEYPKAEDPSRYVKQF